MQLVVTRIKLNVNGFAVAAGKNEIIVTALRALQSGQFAALKPF